jgi:CubicO group peptidase (beta-lactamase class C family)
MEEDLRDWFDEQTSTHGFSGAALAWRGGRPIFSYSGGMAHRGHAVRVDDRTRFGVASVTKMVTAVAVLRLVDGGLVALDQPVIDLLPPAHRPAALTREHTLHHLLSHTSGLANYHDDEDDTLASFLSCWDRIPTYHIRQPADMLPLFADLPAVDAPGRSFRYNDAGFIVAGLAIEALTGRPYVEAVADEVFTPAGMTDTAFDALDHDPPRLAVGYVIDDGPPEHWRSNIFSVTATGMPDGGMITSLVDLARFVDALLGGRLVSRPLVEAMIRPQGPPSDAIEQFGYGCQLALQGGRVAVIGHGGSDPGVSARVAHHLRTATTIVVLCNQDRGSWAAYLRIAQALGLSDPRAVGRGASRSPFVGGGPAPSLGRRLFSRAAPPNPRTRPFRPSR